MNKLEQLIKSLNFYYVNSNIENSFEYEKSRGEVELINFNKNISSEEVLIELDKQGLIPANLTELLEFAKNKPKEAFNSDYLVAALGSVADVGGRRQVPYLDGWGGERGLRLGWFDGDWDGDCRFAAVRKSLDTKKLDTLDPWVTERLKEIEKIIEEIKNHSTTNNFRY